MKRSTLASIVLSVPLYAGASLLHAAEPAFDDAVPARLRQVLAAAAAKEGATSSHSLPLIEELAKLRLRRGDLAEGAALRRRALKIAIAHFGGESARAAGAMVALALVDIEWRRYLDAEPLLIASQRILDERVAPDHPARAAVLAALARVALARGNTAEAEKWARQAVDIARHNPNLRSSEALRALGATLAAEERFSEAEQALNKALAQDRRHFGPDAPESARSLVELGNAKLRAHRFREALFLLEHAAAIDQARLGPAHPSIADDLFDLGLAYDGLKRDAEARRAFAAAIAVLEHGDGRGTPRLAYAELELARMERLHGNEVEAEAMTREAKRILYNAQEEEHRRERQT